MITLAVDAMGGDFAPQEVVKGVVEATKQLPDVNFILVGKEPLVRQELEPYQVATDKIRIMHAEEVVTMAESPVDGLKRKRDSSIAVSVKLVKTGEADAIVSAGNTGAAVAASYMTFGCLKSVRRPGIAITFYIHNSPVVVMDVGANIHCKPKDLVAYAVMGSLYSREVLNVENPRIGLLNIGVEGQKGNPLVQKTGHLLSQSNLNYIGSIEGDNLFSGSVDVVICEGFVGNIVLKISEGLSHHVLKIFLEGISLSQKDNPELIKTLHTELDRFRWRIDYAEQGGAPLFGLSKPCIICHGRSHARAMTNAMKCAVRIIEKDLSHKIEDQIQEV